MVLKCVQKSRFRAAPLESDLQRQVLDWLKLRRIFAWRMPIGPVIQRNVNVKGGETRTAWKRSPLKGFPDIAGVLQKERRGVLFTLELKSGKGRVTPEQVAWMVDLQAAGAASALIRSMDDLYRVMREWGEVD